jgi:four helix bundle protein
MAAILAIKNIVRNYQRLDAWKIAMQLVISVYGTTKDFPKEEKFGLTSQVNRAAVSITANIAEGMARQHKKETCHFLHIARGSAYELETLINVGQKTNLLSPVKFNRLIELIDKTIKLLSGLINYFKTADLR